MSDPRNNEVSRVQALEALRQGDGGSAIASAPILEELLDPHVDDARFLLLWAWVKLARVAEKGPDSVATKPPLPEGSGLPEGAEPSQIADPALRLQSIRLAKQHAQEVVVWNTKQEALSTMRQFVERCSRAARERPELGAWLSDLAHAMALEPGVPEDLGADLLAIAYR